MKERIRKSFNLKGKRLTIYCLCFLLSLESFGLYAMVLGPGLLRPQKISFPPELDETLEEPAEEIESPEPIEEAEIEEPSESILEQERRGAREKAREQGFLVLINKTNTVDKDYKPDDLTSIKYFASNRSEAGRYMRKEAAEHFHLLVETALEEDFKIVLTTAYRSYGFQKILWDNYVAKDGEAAASMYSARPGTSEHQSGLAVDVSSPSVSYELTQEYANTEEGQWLAKNAHRFGFIIRYPKGKEDITGYMYEPWHLRYVTKSVAEEIYEADITLEEYLKKYMKE